MFSVRAVMCQQTSDAEAFGPEVKGKSVPLQARGAQRFPGS